MQALPGFRGCWAGSGERAPDGDVHVWHCSLSLRADEGPLGDERWDAVAQDFAAQMGFAEASGRTPIRWVAIQHGVWSNGNDHIHVAATMVREDGTRWDGRFNDYRQAQQSGLARTIEVKCELPPS